MSTNFTSELLIRITADPSSAEESIRRFRAEFANGLGDLAGVLNGWSLRGLADFTRIRNATLDLRSSLSHAAMAFTPLQQATLSSNRSLQDLVTHSRLSLASMDTAFQRSRQNVQAWKTALAVNFAQALTLSDTLHASLLRSFVMFDTALGTNAATALIWQRSIGDAFRKAAISAIGSIAQEALIRAIYATALGFYLLAVQDYRGAALAFKSAATFGILGGTAAAAGRALAAPEASEGRSASGPSAPSSPGAASPQASLPQPPLQVIFQGPVYGGQAGIDELVRHISQAVTDRDLNLVAYTVVRQPATRA